MTTGLARRTRAAAPPADDTEPTLDAAVARIRELSLRLWAVRAAHPGVHTRWRGLRCATCGQAYPCATVRAAGGSAVGRAVSRAGR